MKNTLGMRIAALRRERGLTQEALARAIGISAPAVSKWETDASCPDIAMLCPLARALGTNVDTLLAFEENLSREQITKNLKQIVSVARSGNLHGAQKQLCDLVRQFPSSADLLYNAALTLDLFDLLEMGQGEASWRENRRIWKRRWLEELLGDADYKRHAAVLLASMELEEGHLDRAQQLLSEEEPPTLVEPTVLRVRLYHARGEDARALETVQKQLFHAVHQVQTCLMLMTDERMQPDAQKRLEIARIIAKVDALFGVNAGMSVGELFEQYLKLGQTQEALKALGAYVFVLTGPAKGPNPLLFDPTYKVKGDRAAAPPEMRKVLLKGLMEEEQCAPLRSEPAFQEAVQRLRKSLASEGQGE